MNWGQCRVCSSARGVMDGHCLCLNVDTCWMKTRAPTQKECRAWGMWTVDIALLTRLLILARKAYHLHLYNKMVCLNRTLCIFFLCNLNKSLFSLNNSRLIRVFKPAPTYPLNSRKISVPVGTRGYEVYKTLLNKYARLCKNFNRLKRE